MKIKKARGKGFPCFKVLPLLLSFIILFSSFPIIAYAKDFKISTHNFEIGSNYFIDSDEYAYGSPALTHSTSSLPYSFSDSNIVLSSPILFSDEIYLNQNTTYTLDRNDYINFDIFFYASGRYTSVSRVFIQINRGKIIDISNYNFNINSGHLTFNYQSNKDYTITNLDVGVVLNYSGTYNNTYLKITDVDISTSSNHTGLLNTILGWLQSIYDRLQNVVSTISNGLSNLSTSVSTKFTNLTQFLSNFHSSLSSWLSTVKTAITDKIALIQGWLSSLGDRISGFFTSIWDNISDTWSDFADWLYSLFVPSDSWWTSYSTMWDSWVNSRFGAVIQVMDITEDLFETIGTIYSNEELDDFNFTIPTLRMKKSVFGGGAGYYTLFNSQTYSFNRDAEVLVSFDFWTYYRVAVDAILTFGLLVFLKKQFNRVFTENTESGDNL